MEVGLASESSYPRVHKPGRKKLVDPNAHHGSTFLVIGRTDTLCPGIVCFIPFDLQHNFCALRNRLKERWVLVNIPVEFQHQV